MNIAFWRKEEKTLPPVEASAEAKAALAEAKKIRERADTVYAHRAQLLERNHFAERIRLSYEGHR